jgi:Silicon transporter
MWEGVPPGVAVIIFFLLMGVVGMLEGMQIAFFLAARVTADKRGSNMWAKRVNEILFHGDAFNLSGFMIGRQLSVVSCMFFVARVTSLNIDPYGGETLWGVSPGTQKFFNMGFLGALITTIVASLAWQLVAAAFPIAFMSNPFTYVFLRICLFLEGTGICNGAYVVAAIYRKIYGYKRDEVYIGTAEERRLKQKGDDPNNLKPGAGHLYKLPIDLGRKEMTLAELEVVLEQLTAHAEEVEDRIKELSRKKTALAQLEKEHLEVQGRMEEIQQRRSQVFDKDDLEDGATDRLGVDMASFSSEIEA